MTELRLIQGKPSVTSHSVYKLYVLVVCYRATKARVKAQLKDTDVAVTII